MRFRLFSLRLKLTLVSVLLLAIPVAGFQYAAEMQAYLMSAEEQAMALTAKAVSTILHERPDLFESNILSSFDEQREIHAYSLKNQIKLDGFTDEWADLLGKAKYYGFDNVLENYGIYEDETLNFRHIVAQRGSFYYVLFIVNDDSLVFRNQDYPGLNKSDHLQIAVKGQYEGQHDLYFMSPSKSGNLNAHLMRKDPLNFVPERYDPDIYGYWRKTEGGYNIEIRLPVAKAKNGRISFAIADVDNPLTKKINTVVGTSGTRQSADLAFILAPSPMLGSIISSLHSPSARIRVIDSRLRQRASVGQYYNERDNFPEKQASFSWRNLLKPLYDFFSARYEKERSPSPMYMSKVEDPDLKLEMRQGKSFTLRRSLADSDAEILIAGEPIKYENKVMGTVLVEQGTNNILTEKNRIIEKTINSTLAVFFLGGFVLIAFATRLSNRIRGLVSQTEKAIGPDGRIRDGFTASSIQDELGDLSRRFGDMFDQLQKYNAYQEKMANTLEHEIRTPLAGISANIVNLEKKIGPKESAVQKYLAGIRDNIKRVESIMAGIREATSLKKALGADEQLTFNLKEFLVVWVRNGYRQTFAENSFVLQVPEGPVALKGAPDRILQMLDKLMENAVDFSPVESPITVALTTRNNQARLSITNEGPELPNEFQSQIFDSMVSLRQKPDAKLHLGLGLYVARLIAEFHGGTIQAENRKGMASGVVFTVLLPLFGSAR